MTKPLPSPGGAPTPRVVVVGSVNVDLVVRAARLPAAGETVAGGEFARHHGGKGGNQAVAAARLGATALIVGAVGDDDFGAAARAGLDDEGVGTAELLTVSGIPTGVAVIVVDAAGDNQIAVAPGANAEVTPAAVAAALGRLAVGPRDVVLVGHEIPTAAAREALVRARAAGAVTVLNPAPATGLGGSELAQADVLTPNRGELLELVRGEAHRTGRFGDAPSDPARAAAALLRPGPEGDGPGAVLVTLGAAGAVLVRPRSSPLTIPAPAVAAVDATGAGDALNGALAAGLAAGLDLASAAARAVVAATLSTLAPGARGGLPSAAQLDRAAGHRAAQRHSPEP